MAVSSFSNSGIKSGSKRNKFWDQIAAIGDFESIATTTVGSGGIADVTFSSIPATYTHLQLRGIARTNRADSNQDAVVVRFNSDTGNNYSRHYLLGNGSAASSSATTSTDKIMMNGFTNVASLASAFGGFILDILDYKKTNKYKTTRQLSAREDNSTGNVWFESGNWRNTNAITSIVLTPNIGTLFDQYSSFALYGVKA